MAPATPSDTQEPEVPPTLPTNTLEEPLEPQVPLNPTILEPQVPNNPATLEPQGPPTPHSTPLTSNPPAATYKVLGTSTRVVEEVEGCKGRSKRSKAAVVLELPPHLSSPVPQLDGGGGKEKTSLRYVPPWRRRKEDRSGGEREEDRRPWYEKIDEHFDKLEAENRVQPDIAIGESASYQLFS